MTPFPSLSKTHGIPLKEIFRYLQIKNFFQPPTNSTISPNQFSVFENVCDKDPHARNVISALYSQLLSQPVTGKLSYVRKWEEDFGAELSTVEWGQIWNNTKTASSNVQAAETNYKVLTRWYLVPTRVAKFSSNYSELCFRECSDIGTYIHTWWSCPKAQIFWSEVFQLINALTNISFPLDPKMAIFNLKPDNLSYIQFNLISQLLTAAKQTIANAWKTPNVLISETVSRMNTAMTYAKMSAIEVDTIARFESIWEPWITHTMQNTFVNEVMMPW